MYGVGLMTAPAVVAPVSGPVTLAHHPVAPSELWSSWHPDPVIVAVLALSVVLYHHGLSRLRARHRGPAVSWRAVVSFDAGVAALAVALVSPLDAAAASVFWAHMVQHLVLMVVAAPLLVCGRPGTVLPWALPARQRRLVRRAGARRPVSRVVEVLSHPLVAWAVGTTTLWAWHHPALYDAAVRHDLVHALEHVTLLGTAAVVWAVALGRTRATVPVPLAAMLLFATALQSGALGAVLTLAREPLYEAHTATAPLWGMTPLGDQQLAGALMWMPPSLLYVAVTAALLVRWLASLDAPTDRPIEARVDAHVAAGRQGT